MDRTIVYDTYWRFAAERQRMYERRLAGEQQALTDDAVLSTYRFTNVFRAADRVSQYLIREVQYREDRSQAPAELFFRTMLFKIFNKIDTWETLERQLGPISWQSFDANGASRILATEITNSTRIYSAAYIMPAPKFGHVRKHDNHLALLNKMMMDGLPGRLQLVSNLKEVYQNLLAYPGIGPFLAFQYTIDLNYSRLLDFDEGEYVVAGPGALDGIAKCFTGIDKMTPEDIIAHMVEMQDREFGERNLEFRGLFGRKLQPIDCQNIFCEISKYARVAHPEIIGLSGRTRIKQGYKPAVRADAPPMFPPRWNLNPPTAIAPHQSYSYSNGERLLL